MRSGSRLSQWAARRGGRYISRRLAALLQRYGVSSAKGKRRVLECTYALARCDCLPAFATPGRVVARNPSFCRELQDLGAELLVHGFDHVDFRALSEREAREQFERAAEAFDHAGIRYSGFRCPYLSLTDDVLRAVPDGLFEYSSNLAVWWDVVAVDRAPRDAILRTLAGFYGSARADATVSVPRRGDRLVEIPVALPDDLQLVDGLHLGDEAISDAWLTALRASHTRGEFFAPLFHPELFDRCRLAFEAILAEARALRPAVWMTQLRNVSAWWSERVGFDVEATRADTGFRLNVRCTPRATVLMRNVDTDAPRHRWDDSYDVLEAHVLDVRKRVRPFVGVGADAPERAVMFLREQGYVVETGETAKECGIFLDAASFAGTTEVELVDLIEASPAPLVRFGRWPDEARSAFSLAGDLDALGLVDYAVRVGTPWRSSQRPQSDHKRDAGDDNRGRSAKPPISKD